MLKHERVFAFLAHKNQKKRLKTNPKEYKVRRCESTSVVYFLY